ncbi:IS4 family transposase [Hymenobacter jeollabukensis]|nr:IS4 family transposase [Hymenobacter jeollabukensis]
MTCSAFPTPAALPTRRLSEHFADADQWTHRQFGAVQLGDRRRTRRVETLVAAWARHPGASIPQACAGQSYACKAAYYLLAQPHVTPDVLQQPHREQVRAALQEPGTFLLLEDTTEVIWPKTGQRRAGLGPVGQGAAASQGVLLHSVIAARWTAGAEPASTRRPPVPVLGLLDQQFYLRVPIPATEKALAYNPYQRRQKRARESDLWTNSLRQLEAPPTHARWVVVADRGADIHTHLQYCQQRGLGFVVRSAQDRALVDPSSGASAGRLRAQASTWPPCGQFSLPLRTRPGAPKRDVVLQLSFSPLLALRAPQRPGFSTGRGDPVRCGAVRVWEAGTDGRAPALEWLLLCDQAAQDVTQALACVQQYASRWLIEDFHKALKSGVRIERLQLHTGPRLFAAIALLSVVALALVDLREQVHQMPAQSAEQAGLSETALAVLRRCTAKPLQTGRDVWQAIAQLGGHLSRVKDRLPGWQTLWKGLMTLRLLVTGFRFAVYSP